MTKEQLATMVKEVLEANASPTKSKYDVRDIYILISLAYNSMVTDSIVTRNNHTGKQIIQRVDGGFITPLTVKIEKDIDRDRYFATLTQSIVKLPGDRGVRQISYMQDEEFMFIHNNTGQTFVNSQLEVSDYPGYISFWLEGQTIWFETLPWELKLPDVELLVKVVKDITDLEEDEEVMLPGGGETYIIDWVFDKLGISKQTVPDQYSDNSQQTE